MTTVLDERADFFRLPVHAILVGTGNHPPDGELPSVMSVLPTLRAVRDCLIQQCGVPESSIQVFEDPSDASALEKAVRKTALAASDGIFFFYYVGHGIVDPDGTGELYLALATADSTMLLEGQRLRYDTVRRAAATSSRRRQPTVVILDCCNSGRATRDAMPVAPLDLANSHVQGAFVMAASGNDEDAWAPSDEQYTAFSGKLINLLRYGNGDLPPVLTLDDVYGFLRRNSPSAPRRYNNDHIGRLVMAGNPGYSGPSVSRLTLPDGPPQPGCPYPGLNAFETADHAMFHGRDKETSALLEKVREAADEHRLQIVVGPSGVGKSSLLKAGLLSAVSEGRLQVPGSFNWFQKVIVPGARPLKRLRAVLARDDDPMILVVDQFEEIFSPNIDEETRESFIQTLHTVATEGRVVVLGLRSDFITACMSYPLLETALGNNFLLSPIRLGALQDIVELPARRAGLALEHGLIETLLGDADVGVPLGRTGPAGPGVLPLLSHALYITWKKRIEIKYEGRAMPVLTVNGYLDSGRIRGALEFTAESVYRSLRPALRPVARRIFVDLVQLTDSGTATIPTRRVVPRVDLARPGDPDGAVDEAIEAFTQSRILTSDESTVQIAHETLLTAWKTLEGWVSDDQAWVRLQREIQADAARWDEVNMAELLYAASRLDTVKRALDTLRHTQVEMDSRSRRFLDASNREHRRKLRLRRGLQSTGVVLLLLSLGATTAAVQQTQQAQQQRDHALSREKAIEANQLRTVDPALSRQVSATAYRVAPTLEARSELLSTQSLPVETRLTNHTGQILDTALSQDRNLLVTAGDDGRVRLWDVADSRHPRQLATVPASADAGDAIFAVALSRKNRVLATGTDHGAVRLWDVTRPGAPAAIPTRLSAGGERIQSLAFAPDGTMLVGADKAGTIHRWGIPDGVEQPKLSTNSGIRSMAFSSNGEILAVGDEDGNVRLWHVADRRDPQLISPAIPTLPMTIATIEFSPDGRLLAVAAYDNTVRLWRVSSSRGAMPYGKPMQHANSVYALAFSRDGKRLAAAGSDSAIRVSDVATQNPVVSLPLTNPVQSLEFLGDSDDLISAGNDGLLRFWQLGNRMISAQQGNQILVALTRNGRLLASGGFHSHIKLWDLTDPAKPRPLPPISAGARATVQRMSFSDDGRLLAVPQLNGTITLWDMANPRHPVRHKPVLRAGDGIHIVAFSPNRRYLASGQQNGTVLIWDLHSPNPSTPIATIADRNGAIFGIAYSPDGRLLAIGGGDSTTKIYDMTRPAAPKQLGQALTGQSRYINSVRFAPDGRTLATGAGDGTIFVWQVENLTAPPVRMRNAGSDVLDMTFLRKDLIAVGNVDGSLWIWSLDSQKAAIYAKLHSSDRPVFAVAADATGRTVVTADGEGAVISWSADPEQVIREICASVGKRLTERELNDYVHGLAAAKPCG